MISIKLVHEIAQRIINETIDIKSLPEREILILQAGFDKLLLKLHEIDGGERCPHGFLDYALCLICGED